MGLRTEDTRTLIAELVDDLARVRTLPSPWVRGARSLAVATVFTSAGVLLLGTPPDVWRAFHQTWFTAHVFATLVMAVLAAAVAFVLSVPDAPLPRAVRWLPVGVGVAWAAFLTCWLVLAEPPATAGEGVLSADACLTAVAVVAVLPAVLLLVMVTRAASLEPAWSAGLGTAGGAGLAAAGAFLHCLNVEPMHALVSHVAPVVLFAFGGALAGSWWRRDISRRIRQRL